MTAKVRKVLGATAVLAVAGVIAGPVAGRVAMAQSRPPSVPPGEVAIPDVGKTSTVTRTGDLRPLEAHQPFDGARATLVMVSHGAGSSVRLKVTGIGRSAAGRMYGAHLHTGPCVAGNGAAAGPHYNTDVLDGRKPPRVDRTREVWLDFTVSSSGSGTARTVVPFAPKPGDRSIVIHDHATDPHGTAAPRLACLPLTWR